MDQRRIGEALPTLSVIDRLRLLRRVPLFAGLSPDDLKSLAEIASEETFGPGEVLAEQGEPGEELYVLVSGEVGVVLGLGAPGEREVARHGPGDHAGEMAVVGGGPRSASLVARTDVRALMVDRPHLESLLRERPEVSLSLMRALVERVQESTRLLPANLGARTEGGARPLPGSLQRRVVTMLFCDLVGSTGIAERLDPEEWGDIVDEAYALLVEPVERYGGTLARFMGDAILAFFGAPVAHEDDAERAVRAGLDMVEAVGPLRERLDAQGLPFDVRVGINTGLVRTGELGPDARVEYTALGDAVNVAARMEQSAAPGTVQISEPTSREAAPLFELEDLGPIQVKGKLEPVRAYRVVGPKARPGRVHGIEGLLSPLVGRDREMAALRELAGAVRVGTGHVVLLVGEAGLGKSRMIDELRAEWVRPGAGDPARWVEARAISYEANRPYALVQQFLRQVCGLGERDDADAVRARVAAFVETIGPAEPARTRAVFELLLGVDPVSEDPDGEPTASRLPEGEDLKREVLAIASEACRAWAAGASGVVVADDLHWSDPASLEFLLHLLPVAAEAPVLFVCACRPDPPDLPDRIAAACPADRHTPMPLAPLAADETAVLLAELLRMPDLPDELRHLVVDRAAGNPLFVEETLRALIDAGAVVRKDGRWRMVEQAQVTFPDHLQGLLAARVDRLEPGPRRTLQLAAVIGRSFGYRVLRSICDDPDDLGDHLDKLERAGLIVETAEVPDLELGFRHPLLQEAAYGSMLIRERRTYHARVGEALEPDLADRDDRAATLAHHFDQAGDTERALRYRTAAARRAARLFAHTEAIAQFERALELARQSGTTGAELFALYRRLGHSLQVCGQHERALRVFEDMEREARRLGERATELAAVTAQATIRAIPSEMQDPDLALGLLDRSLSLAADIGDRAAAARAHWNRMLMMQFMVRDVEEAASHGERALAIARELHLDDLTAYTLHDLADSLFFLGRPEEAWSAIRESRALFERLDNQTMLADSLGREGHILLVAGRYREALSLVDRSLEVARKIGSPWGEGYSLFVRARVRWELGELGSALEDARRLADLAPSASRLIQVGACSDLAVMLAELGALGSGLEQARTALSAAPGFEPLRPWALGAHARLLVLQGHLDEAEEAARAGREALSARGALLHLHMTMEVVLAQAEVALARGEAGAAMASLDEITEYMAARGIRWRLGDISRLGGRALVELGRPAEAWEVLAAAHPELEGTGARRGLWRVLVAMADLAERQGDGSRAAELRWEAREVLAEITRTLADPELRASFTALPEVRALLGGGYR